MKPEVCFVVGLVSFRGTAGVGKKERQGHSGQAFQHFYIFTRRFKLTGTFSLWSFYFLNFSFETALCRKLMPDPHESSNLNFAYSY